MGTWYIDLLGSAVPLVSSLKVTFDRKGRIVNLGSAFLNFKMAALGSFGIPDNLEVVLDDLEAWGDWETPLIDSFGATLEALDFLSERGPSLGNIEEKKPRVGSKGDNWITDSGTDIVAVVPFVGDDDDGLEEGELFGGTGGPGDNFFLLKMLMESRLSRLKWIQRTWWSEWFMSWSRVEDVMIRTRGCQE